MDVLTITLKNTSAYCMLFTVNIVFWNFKCVSVYVCMFVNHFTVLNMLLTVGYSLKTLKATCPEGSSEELKIPVRRRWPPQNSPSYASEGTRVEGKLTFPAQTGNSLFSC